MSTHDGVWTPILNGDLCAKAWEAIDAIAHELGAHRVSAGNGPTLAGGSAGIAILFAALHEASPRNRGYHADVAVECVSNAIATLGSRSLSASLYAGFPGVAWAAEYLGGRIVERGDDANDGIDAALCGLLDRGEWSGDYDLISGLVGLGAYALHRRKRSARGAILTKVVRHLRDKTVRTRRGATWHTAPHLLATWQRDLYPCGYYNLGLAHGVPGVMAFLAQASVDEATSTMARPLLDDTVRWVLSHRRDITEGGPSFPTVVTQHEDYQSAGASRVAWCYGDLGIAIALLWAARAIGRAEWEAAALEIARHAARRSESHSGVVDAGLCHGAAGNAHLFNRLYQATGEDLFLTTARRCFEEALSYRRPGDGIGGFRAWNGRDGWRTDPGLLEGAAGVGLALLAAVGTSEPDWDHLLLVSVPPVLKERPRTHARETS